MAKNKQKDQTEVLRALLGNLTEPASLEQVEAAAGLPISRRTLIRRLAEMVEQDIVSKTGTSRAARYQLSQTSAPQTPPAPSIPLSKEGVNVLKLVSRPMPARKAVGYQLTFLDGYRPNRTSYLSPAERKHLLELGRTTGTDLPAGTYAQKILDRLLIDLSWNSSRLEGNTYSLLDTQRLIENGEAAEGKAAIESQMILNHKAAIEFLVQSIDDIGFNRHTILNLHALLADNLLGDPSAPGRLRTERIGIGQSVYLPLEVPQLIEEFFDQLLATAAAIRDPFEQAFFVMIQLPYLQPFIDVNKRVSRLALNIPFIKRNLSPLSFVAVPDTSYTQGLLGVYELNRIELIKDVFLWAYERSSERYAAVRQSLGEPDAFRLRHRAALKQVIAEIIRGAMQQSQAAVHIKAWANRHVTGPERARFIEVVETELLSLHEGNFARYQIRPSEFQAWRKAWERRPARKSPRLRNV